MPLITQNNPGEMALPSKRNLSLNKKVIYANTIVAKCFFQVIFKSHKYIMRSDSGAWGIKWLQTKLSISSNKKQKEPKAIHGR